MVKLLTIDLCFDFMSQNRSFLKLLQLSSPSLPLGAYSYSEGLEYLVETKITTAEQLLHWLKQELTTGSIRIETAVMLRGYRYSDDREQLNYWNDWLTATRETKELRQQSSQMGKSLMQLFRKLIQAEGDKSAEFKIDLESPNYPIVFGVASRYWQIPEEQATLAYLHSWTSNLVNNGVKLIPLGQTAGQQTLYCLGEIVEEIYQDIINLEDNQLYSCNLGLSLASMNHEQQYTRLFRS